MHHTSWISSMFFAIRCQYLRLAISGHLYRQIKLFQCAETPQQVPSYASMEAALKWFDRWKWRKWWLRLCDIFPMVTTGQWGMSHRRGKFCIVYSCRESWLVQNRRILTRLRVSTSVDQSRLILVHSILPMQECFALTSNIIVYTSKSRNRRNSEGVR